jgi:hypothetical protein
MNGHGGARPGAGRKRKWTQWIAEFDDDNALLADALPRVTLALIRAAERGDPQAIRLVYERLFGRHPLGKALPFAERALEEAARESRDGAEAD